MADLVAQGNNNGSATIAAAELSQILAYPNLILYPNDPSAVQVVVSQLSVSVGASGAATGTVVGSWANANGATRPVGQQLSIDSDIAAAFIGASSSYVILGEVYYPFQPYGVYLSVPQVSLHDSIMMIPRTAAEITVQ